MTACAGCGKPSTVSVAFCYGTVTDSREMCETCASRFRVRGYDGPMFDALDTEHGFRYDLHGDAPSPVAAQKTRTIGNTYPLMEPTPTCQSLVPGGVCGHEKRVHGRLSGYCCVGAGCPCLSWTPPGPPQTPAAGCAGCGHAWAWHDDDHTGSCGHPDHGRARRRPCTGYQPPRPGAGA